MNLETGFRPVGCICTVLQDQVIVNEKCPAVEHGFDLKKITRFLEAQRIVNAVSERRRVAEVVESTVEVNQCYAVETSWGDDGPTWWVYRRVKRVVANRYAECYRFEARAEQIATGGGPSYVVYPSDVIAVTTLLRHTPIDQGVWEARWSDVVHAIGEPWNVE